MNLSEYAQYDGLGLAEVIRKRDVTPTEVAELFLQAVAKVNPHINAVIEVYADALELAAQSNLQAPFGGVPFLRKDLGATEAGRRQELGSRLFKGYVPECDSYLTTRFKKAGLAIMGRSAVPELGISGQTETILQGITRNPWNLERMAGGSSGGAAASVAAGIVPLAHAGDGGGSIRIPASCCGLVGLNPSRGRISAGPNRQDPMFGLAREFIVSRSVRDTAAMLDAVCGAAPGDPLPSSNPSARMWKRCKPRSENSASLILPRLGRRIRWMRKSKTPLKRRPPYAGTWATRLRPTRRSLILRRSTPC